MVWPNGAAEHRQPHSQVGSSFAHAIEIITKLSLVQNAWTSKPDNDVITQGITEEEIHSHHHYMNEHHKSTQTAVDEHWAYWKTIKS